MELPNIMPTSAAAADPDQRRRSREAELDLYVAHELATGSPAASVLWEAVGFVPPAAPVLVVRQAPRDDSRTTDVSATSNGKVLLCENKAAGGSFEILQPESYAAHCRAHPEARAVLIAPRTWIDHSRDPLFHASVPVEDLAAALDRAADALDGEAAAQELRLSYRFRAQELRRYAHDVGYQGNPDEQVAAFGILYRRLLADVAGSTLSLKPSSLRNRTAGFASITGPALVDGNTLMHKLNWGWLHLLLRGGTVADFQARVSSAGPDKAPPAGWLVRRQKTGKTPVLQFDVPPLNPQTASAEEAVPVITQAIRQIIDLGQWLSADGMSVLYG